MHAAGGGAEVPCFCLSVTLLSGIEFVLTVSSLSPLNLATILISLDRESFVLFVDYLCIRVQLFSALLGGVTAEC